MPTGRKPRPTYLKLLEGNPGKRPINKKEPKPKVVNNKSPEWLSASGKETWKKLSPMMKNLGILTEIDEVAFTMLCQEYGRYIDAQKKVNETNVLHRTPNGNVTTSPYLWVSNKAYDNFCRLMAEFGMTPSSRTRIQVDFNDGDNEDDALESLLSGI